jgi:hypothetical protein
MAFGNPYLAAFHKLEGDIYEAYRRRMRMVKTYAHAIPTADVIHKIVKHSPIVEIGAGTGYWAHFIAECGGDVVAFDKAVPERYWFKVKKGGPRMAARYPERTLLLCWPSYDVPFAQECLDHYKGSTLIYIGEWRGCTADEAFHDTLERDWKHVETIEIPQWFGIHDCLWIYERCTDVCP